MKSVKRGKVSASLTGIDANLSVYGAFRIAEDAITEFMGELKIDNLTAKREYNAIWVFAKTKMKFPKNIAWNEEYTATCFLSKISHIIIDIDVAVANAAGELCVYSRTELCALDSDSGKIRKVNSVGVRDDFKTEEPLTDILFTKIDAENLPEAGKIKIGYTSLDYSVHTNNKEYARFMLDTYTAEEAISRPVREMEIVYANQSFGGDELTIRKGCLKNKDVFVIEKDGTLISKGEILR